MKKLLDLVLFTSILISQDVVTTVSNEEYKGLVTGIEEEFIVFIRDNSKVAQKIPIKVVKEIKMLRMGKIHSFSNFDEISSDLFKSEEELLAEKEEQLIVEKCQSNLNIRFMVIPIKDDYYGLTEEVETLLDDSCYSVIDNIDGLAYLDEKKIRGEDINDFHLTSIGKDLKLNFILYGYTYTFEEPFKYAGNPTATAADLDRAQETRALASSGGTLGGFKAGFYGNDKSLSRAANYEEAVRGRATAEAGTYLGFTLFQIDIKTGEKKILLNNSRYRKL